MSTNTKQKALFATSATAMGAIGLLASPSPAQAIPMFPLAPVCSFNGTYVLNQSNGFRVEFPWNGATPSGTAIAFGNDQKPALSGPVVGGVTSANEVAVTIDWVNTPAHGQYVGKLDAGGNVRGGFNQDLGNPGSTATWDSVTPLTCVEPAAPAPPVQPPPAEKPADKPADKPATPEKKTATVPLDTDVYDAPDGVGNRIGSLQGGEGQTVELFGVGCRDDQWCNIVWPGRADGAWTFFGPQ